MKKYIFAIALLSVCLCSQAQTKWSLRQCIDYAVEHNIEIKQEAINVENSKINLNTSKNSRLPDLNASASQNFNFGRVVSQATNAKTTANSSSTSFGIISSADLFTGFRIPNEIKMNELNLKAATEGLKKVKENMEIQVTSYYLEVLFKKEILKTYQKQVELSAQQVERTEILVNSGKIPLSQLYDIKAQLASDELNVTTAQNGLDLAVLNLAQTLNLTETESFDVQEPESKNIIADNMSSIISVSEVYRTAIAIKPHVKEAEYLVEGSKKSLKVAQSGYYPTLDFSAAYNTSSQRMYRLDNPNFGRQLDDNGYEYIRFSLNIPLFNRFKTRNQVRSARLDIQNNELRLDNVKLSLYKEIQQAYQNATAAQAKYVSTENAYRAASESFSYAQERYNIGKSTVYEYNEAQTKLLTSESEQIQAKYDFLFRAKILDFYSGKEIDIR